MSYTPSITIHCDACDEDRIFDGVSDYDACVDQAQADGWHHEKYTGDDICPRCNGED